MAARSCLVGIVGLLFSLLFTLFFPHSAYALIRRDSEGEGLSEQFGEEEDEIYREVTMRIRKTMCTPAGVILVVPIVCMVFITACGNGEDPWQEGNGEIKEDWVLIEPGTFMMGSPEDEPNRTPDERLHEVTLTRAFFIGTTPVTQEQWQKLVGNNPSGFHPDNTAWEGRGSEVCLDCPVERVSWWDAVAYANLLSVEEGLDECYTLIDCSGEPGQGLGCSGIEVNADDGNPYLCEGYRLPTEAESEYAQRAGTTTAYHTGPEEGETQEDAMDRAGWHRGNSADGPAPGSDWRTQPVGLLEPNDWGVYDMHGNVVEMVWDYYGQFPEGQVVDPLGPEVGEHRVRRGGSWLSLAHDCRAARRRGGRGPAFTIDRMGFRLARTKIEVD